MIPENEIGKLIVVRRCPECDHDGNFECIYYVNKWGFLCWNCKHWFEMGKTGRESKTYVFMMAGSCGRYDDMSHRVELIWDGKEPKIGFCQECKKAFEVNIKLKPLTKEKRLKV
jgi:hypothetical protein